MHIVVRIMLFIQHYHLGHRLSNVRPIGPTVLGEQDITPHCAQTGGQWILVLDRNTCGKLVGSLLHHGVIMYMWNIHIWVLFFVAREIPVFVFLSSDPVITPTWKSPSSFECKCGEIVCSAQYADSAVQFKNL